MTFMYFLSHCKEKEGPKLSDSTVFEINLIVLFSSKISQLQRGKNTMQCCNFNNYFTSNIRNAIYINISSHFQPNIIYVMITCTSHLLFRLLLLFFPSNFVASRNEVGFNLTYIHFSHPNNLETKDEGHGCEINEIKSGLSHDIRLFL